MQTFSKFCRIATLLVLAMITSARAAEVEPDTHEFLTVGHTTYTNVKVMHRSKSDLFIRHEGGLVSIRVKDLDESAQLQFGYQLAKPPGVNASRDLSVPNYEIPARYVELAEQFKWESRELLSGADRRLLYGIGAAALLVYLVFCWCCGLVCRKAGHEKIAMVWLPWFKQVPLLRAARMSPWWLLASLLPPVFLVVFIVWAFKIAKARGKSPLAGFMLLLPGINVFAFLYLAFADPLESDDDFNGKGKLIPYQQPRRAA